MNTAEIINAFLRGYGRWRTCSWPTEFGKRKLNLEGVKASQAALMARATAGDERTTWLAATRWLDQVEEDARKAEEHAELAADLAILGQVERAMAQVEAACRLESQYTADRTWRPLRAAIAREIGAACGDFETEHRMTGNPASVTVNVARSDESEARKIRVLKVTAGGSQ